MIQLFGNMSKALSLCFIKSFGIILKVRDKGEFRLNNMFKVQKNGIKVR